MLRDVPSVQELHKICFRSPPDIYRRVSIYVTRIALMVGTHANTITALRVLFLVLGIVSFFLIPPIGQLVTVICLQLCLFLDTMDGAIARYNKEANFTGEAMDVLLDHINSSIVYVVLTGLLATWLLGNWHFVLVGILTAILGQYAAFVRALFVEQDIDIAREHQKSSVFRFFHQDNMRLLLLMFTIGVPLSFWIPEAALVLLHAYVFFVVIKTIVLHVMLHNRATKPVRVFSSALAYACSVLFLLLYLFKKHANYGSWLHKKYGWSRIVSQVLLLSSKPDPSRTSKSKAASSKHASSKTE